MRRASVLFILNTVLWSAAFAQGWVWRQTGTTENLYGVAARGLQGATVVGANNTILYSEDDGWDWGPQQGVADVSFHAVSFADHDTGLVAGTSGTILFTTNAGTTWQTIETGWMHPYYAAHQLSAQAGFVGGINSVFQPIVGFTFNGWQTHDFAVFYVMHENVGYEGTIRGLRFVNPQLGYAAIAVWDGQGAICRTLDGGTTWETDYWSPHAFYGIDIHGDEGFGVCAVGANGMIVRGGSGTDWTVRPSPTTETLRGVSFDSQSNLWAVGDNGTIVHSGDGGDTWELQQSPVGTNLNAVSFIWSNFAATDTGYIAGDFGVVLYTADAGGYVPNNPPGEFSREFPEDSVWLPYGTMPIMLQWTGADDPDGDAVSYILHFWSLDSSQPFDSVVATPDLGFPIVFPVPGPPPAGYSVRWTVHATDGQDTTGATNGEGFFWIFLSGAADDNPILPPSSFRLSAYPNPFNPSTTLQLSLPVSSEAVLRVFDVTGREVREMSLGRLPGGSHEISFDGSDLPSGIYFAALETPSLRLTRKLVLMK